MTMVRAAPRLGAPFYKLIHRDSLASFGLIWLFGQSGSDSRRILVGTFRSIVRTRRALALENLALRQQLAVWKARQPRPRLRTSEAACCCALIGRASTV